jgi:hypothetical protein
MVEYIPIIWFLQAVLLPTALVIIGIVSLFKKVHIAEVLAKLFLAFLFYTPATFFAFFYITSLINSIGHKKGTTINGVRLIPELDFTSYALVFEYAIFGLFLCWFVKRDFKNSLNFITGNNEKVQSVFDGE